MKPMPAWFASDAAAVAAVSLQPIYVMLAARGLGADSYAAGLIASVSVFVKLVSGVAGGVVADVGDRRTLMIASGALQAGIWSLFVLVLALHLVDPIIFGAFVIGSSLIWGLLGGAADAALRGIAREEETYVRAKTACEGRNSAIGLVCSPMGALLYCVTPEAVPIVQAALFAVSAVFAALLPRCGNVGIPSGMLGAGVKKSLDLLGEGFRWVACRRTVFALLMSASLINFSFQIWQYGLQYVLLDDGQSALGVSALDVASCVGIMLGAVVAMRARANLRPVKAALSVLMAQIMASACLIAGAAGSASAVLAIAVFSLPMPFASASIQGEIFVEVPDEMQGRARSVLNVVAQGFSLGAPLAASYLSVHGGELSICIVSALPVALALVIARLAA